MPLFEFECPVCNAKREVLQDHQALAPYCSECEDCGAQSYPVRMLKQASAPAFTISGYSAKNGYSTGGGPA